MMLISAKIEPVVGDDGVTRYRVVKISGGATELRTLSAIEGRTVSDHQELGRLIKRASRVPRTAAGPHSTRG